MKALTMSAIITSVGSKVDGSLGLRVVTPELSHEEKVAIMELQGMNTKMLIEPVDEEASGIVSVQKPMNTKTQSQRIRAVLFLLWKQEGEQGVFEDYYKEKTERYITFLKEKLE